MLKTIFRGIQRRVEDVAAQKKGVNREINYLNWWPCNYNELQWFNEFLIHRNVLKPGLPNQITMTSVMGPRYMNKIAKKGPLIFFTAEDTEYRYTDYDDYMIHEADLSLGFKAIQAENYLRFPLWMMYFISPDGTFRSLNGEWWHSLETFHNHIETDSKFKSRPVAISLISRHDHRGNGAGLRSLAVNAFSSFTEVECAGSFRQNTQKLQKTYKNNIGQYLKTCRFNICFENTNSRGYVTEKIFQSLVHGAIPIYWGSRDFIEPEVLTGNGIVFFDSENPTQAISQVKQIEEDTDYRMEFMSKPKLQPTAKDFISSTLNELEKHIKRILLKAK